MKRLFYALCLAAAVAGTAYLAGRHSQTEVYWQITQEPVVGLADTIVAKQLGQLRPADTNAASIYSPAAGVTVRIMAIVVSNTGGNPRAFRLFHDDDGTTYDASTALYWDEALAANTTKIIAAPGIFMDDSSGNLAVRSDAANELTFTVYGIESG